jgi:hypothetical protein
MVEVTLFEEENDYMPPRWYRNFCRTIRTRNGLSPCDINEILDGQNVKLSMDGKSMLFDSDEAKFAFILRWL